MLAFDRLCLAVALAAVVSVTGTSAFAQLPPQRAPLCESGTLPGGATYSIATPSGWTTGRDDLLVFTPGYRFPQDISTLEPPDPGILGPLRSLDLAVATLGYRKPGLAVKEGVQDVEELFTFLSTDPLGCGLGRGGRTWLVGGSEGALIATLVTERQARSTQPFIDGTLAACGTIGDFREQLDHVADFRVVFDALFPGTIPGSAILVPPDVTAAWQTTYEPRVRALVRERRAEVEQLLRITTAYVPRDLASIETAVVTLLRYNVLASSDAIATLGGSPFDNRTRVYGGSGNAELDGFVNSHAERFGADPVALAELAMHYQTSGQLALASAGGADIPLVTLHTDGDPLVPYRQATLYAAKVQANGAADRYAGLPIERFGHCAFEPLEVFGALLALRLLQ